MDGTNTGRTDESEGGSRTPPWMTLVLIPLMIVFIWGVENYLLAGATHLFQNLSFLYLVLYSALSAILVGIIVPFIRIRTAFLSGAVNMFQIGFRSTQRTLIAVSLTALVCYGVLLFTGIVGDMPDRLEGAAIFLLFLPTGIAAVMICWVLVGTHVQAYVRGEGVVISVMTGILLTAFIFALSLSVIFSAAEFPDRFVGFFITGCISAFFFFAVRDVYATIIVVTSSLVILLNSSVDPAYLVPINLVVVFCGIAGVLVLGGIHWHFSRHYTTIQIPGK